jgi:hypothetical protein
MPRVRRSKLETNSERRQSHESILVAVSIKVHQSAQGGLHHALVGL